MPYASLLSRFARSLPLLVAVALGTGPKAAVASEAVERTIDVGGTSRSYLISVPASWDRKAPIPLLLVFHGWGSDPENMVGSTGFDALAERRPAIVAYLRALPGEQRFEVDPPAGRTSADVLFVDALLVRLRERFPIDDRRVFATGFSNGGSFCYRLAADRPGLLAAIAPVAGYRAIGPSPGSVEPIPLLHLHGTADDRVPPPALRGRASDPVPLWAARNGCAPTPTVSTGRTTDGRPFRRADYAGPTTRSDTALLLIEGVDHDWPGGRGGFASTTILDFCFAHPKRAAPAVPAAPTPTPTPTPTPK